MVVFALEPAAIGPQHQRGEHDKRSTDHTANFKHGSSMNHVILNRFLFPLFEELGVAPTAIAINPK